MSDNKQDDKHEGPAHSSPYGLSTLAPAIRLVDTAREIETADAAIGATVGGKLKVIAEQIRLLQEQAQTILEDAKRDLDLHRARCHFKRRVGQIYHLYREDTGGLYWSMLSVDEWNGEPPHEAVGSFRLEADQSWTPVEKLSHATAQPSPAELVEKLLGAGRPDKNR